jgi:hypothetical protein
MLQLFACHLDVEAVQLPDYEAIYQYTSRNILEDINIHERSYDCPKSSHMTPGNKILRSRV